MSAPPFFLSMFPGSWAQVMYPMRMLLFGIPYLVIFVAFCVSPTGRKHVLCLIGSGMLVGTRFFYLVGAAIHTMLGASSGPIMLLHTLPSLFSFVGCLCLAVGLMGLLRETDNLAMLTQQMMQQDDGGDV